MAAPHCRHDARKLELHEFASCLAGNMSLCAEHVGHRHFYDSDYTVFRRKEWMVSVRMYSERSVAARCVNHQGLKNSRMADGVTNLYLREGMYPYLDIFPVWDFHQLAGMSNEVDLPLLPCPVSCSTPLSLSLSLHPLFTPSNNRLRLDSGKFRKLVRFVEGIVRAARSRS
jgi:chondroitin AC lyase